MSSADNDWTADVLVGIESAGPNEIRDYIQDLNILHKRALKRELALRLNSTSKLVPRSPLFGDERDDSDPLSLPTASTVRTPSIDHQVAPCADDSKPYFPTPASAAQEDPAASANDVTQNDTQPSKSKERLLAD
jgi:hypothetical protein